MTAAMHFSSKDELVDEALRRTGAELRSRLSRASTMAAWLRSEPGWTQEVYWSKRRRLCPMQGKHDHAVALEMDVAGSIAGGVSWPG